MTNNIGLYFYRHYYEAFFSEEFQQNWKEASSHDRGDIEKDHFAEVHEPIIGQIEFPGGTTPYRYQQKPNNWQQVLEFKLGTTYPGLLIGSGYAHGISAQGAYKIGFYFDYTTGLPVLPGTSVKGVLRSAFPGRYQEELRQEKKKEKPNKKKIKELENLIKARVAYISYLLQLETVADLKLDETKIEQIEKAIFEGIVGFVDKDTPIYTPIPQRDIFHDAILHTLPEKSLLGSDFITPHKNSNIDRDGLPHSMKNPIPIQFLKVMPGAIFQFQFQFWRGPILVGERILKPEQRIELFKHILLDIGIGAKSNVGYGQLEEVTNEKTRGGQIDDATTQTLKEWHQSANYLVAVVEELRGQSILLRSEQIQGFSGLLYVKNVPPNLRGKVEKGQRYQVIVSQATPLHKGKYKGNIPVHFHRTKPV